MYKRQKTAEYALAKTLLNSWILGGNRSDRKRFEKAESLSAFGTADHSDRTGQRFGTEIAGSSGKTGVPGSAD